jgi:hypothetical protein
MSQGRLQHGYASHQLPLYIGIVQASGISISINEHGIVDCQDPRSQWGNSVSTALSI